MDAIFLQKSKWLNSQTWAMYSLHYYNYKQHYKIHSTSHSSLPTILSFKGSSCKCVSELAERSAKTTSLQKSHAHRQCIIRLIGFASFSCANTIPSPSKIISEDTITTHFHWKKQQHIWLVERHVCHAGQKCNATIGLKQPHIPEFTDWSSVLRQNRCSL